MSQNALGPLPGGNNSQLNITAATAVKATPGTLVRISVNTAGSAAGSANDCAAVGSVASANEICAIPNAVGVITLEWPCKTGIVITPPTGGAVSVSFS